MATKKSSGITATMIKFDLGAVVPWYGGMLPSDLDGTTAPPAGSPNFFMNFGANSLNLWKFHVDFANSANTTFTVRDAVFEFGLGHAEIIGETQVKRDGFEGVDRAHLLGGAGDLDEHGRAVNRHRDHLRLQRGADVAFGDERQEEAPAVQRRQRKPGAGAIGGQIQISAPRFRVGIGSAGQRRPFQYGEPGRASEVEVEIQAAVLQGREIAEAGQLFLQFGYLAFVALFPPCSLGS